METLAIPLWKISAKSESYHKRIQAFTAASAWGKFCGQNFSALKPDRADYSIIKTGIRRS